MITWLLYGFIFFGSIIAIGVWSNELYFKPKYKKEAYNILKDSSKPNRMDLLKIIKGLADNKDSESIELVKKLMERIS